MSLYIKVSGAWNEITGTERPYVKVSGAWKDVSQIYAKVSGVWKQVYEYDNTGPNAPTPTISSSTGSSDTVAWTPAITDAGSGVATATLEQMFNGSTSGDVAGTSFSILSPYSAGSTAKAIATNRRNTPTGQVWRVKYRIVTVDNAGNTTTGAYSALRYTKPLGTYQYFNTAADTRNIGNTAWLSETDEGIIGFSSNRLYGGWFYGSTAFTADNYTSWEPDSGTLYVKRASAVQLNRGNSGTFYLQGHTSGTKSGALTFIGTQINVALSGNDADAYVALNSGMLTNIGNGTLKGFALNDHSTSTAFLRGMSDYSGLVTLVYS